jgi:hypothetical protein
VPALNLSQQRASAAIIPGDPFFLDRLGQIVALEARYVLPTVYEGPEFPMSGGLMNYGASFLGAFGDLATYTGRILKGARPEDLPVEQTTKFEMVINLKTAGAGVDTWCNGRKFGLAEEPRLRRATMAASRLRPTRTPQLLGAPATPLHPM